VQTEQKPAGEGRAPEDAGGNLAKPGATEELRRRADPRYPVDEEAFLSIVGQSSAVPGRIIDLSRGGCLIQIGKSVPVRPRLPVEIYFKVRGTSFRLRGVVQWAIESNAVGIQFASMVPRHMEALAGVLRELETAAAARAEAAKRLAAEQEARETLKPETSNSADARNSPTVESSQPTEPAVAPIQDAAGKSVPAQTGRERRQSVRQEVNDSAEIHLIKIGSILKGRILDLSLGGCRIRTDERFPVGIYTRVETEFLLEGLPFRLGGVIQAIHDHYTVGIRFLDLSERRRQQLTDLMEEIEEMRRANTSADPAAPQG
jgi:hypothetical protein